MNWLHLNRKLFLLLFFALLLQNTKAQNAVQAINWPNQTPDTLFFKPLNTSKELFNAELYQVEADWNHLSILSIDRRKNIVLASQEMGSIEYYDLRPLKSIFYTGNFRIEPKEYPIGNVLEICAETRTGHSAAMGGAASVYTECAVLSLAQKQILFTYAKVQNADSWSYILPPGADLDSIPADSLQIEGYNEISEIHIQPLENEILVTYKFESTVNEEFEGGPTEQKFGFGSNYIFKIE